MQLLQRNFDKGYRSVVQLLQPQALN